MAQFDVYPNPDVNHCDRLPFLLDVQNNLLSTMLTRVVVPLGRPEVVQNKPIKKVNPLIKVDGDWFVMFSQEVKTLHRKYLVEPCDHVEDQKGDILASLDFLVSGI